MSQHGSQTQGEVDPTPDPHLFNAKGMATLVGAALVVGLSFFGATALSQRPQDGPPDGKGFTKKGGFPKKGMGQEALKEPYKGVSTNGQIIRGLFPIKSTGVTTQPVKEAAEAFLAALSPEQRSATSFPVDDVEWRDWMNVHMYPRKGVSLRMMTEPQRTVAMALVKASLSAKGLKTTTDIMKLNQTLGELLDNLREFGEDLYYFTIMGKPSTTEPWGWQLDGHHLIVNYFVLGDQVVMTPTFLGSEPTVATSGKYQGTEVLQSEQNKGLAFVNTLTEAQLKVAVVQGTKHDDDTLAGAFKDNVVIENAGIKASKLTSPQKEQLLDLIAGYVGDMDEGHAKVKMDDVRSQIDETYFAWIGKHDADSVFYYRIQSPVILIEFDHVSPGPMAMGRGGPGGPGGPPPGGPGGPPPGGPGGPGGGRPATRQHIHVVIRTPNGNDYGKDLLRQHYEQHPHTATN